MVFLTFGQYLSWTLVIMVTYNKVPVSGFPWLLEGQLSWDCYKRIEKG